ncbi:MAG: hypothetical protein INH43_06520 [Acidobacteriaceae bacterium]|nr:hypothetical protein [Acidobacteriaceae bacterium]
MGGAFGILEEVGSGVGFVVAEELEQGAVVLVGAAFGGDVNLAGTAAEFGGVDTGLDLELLEGFDGGEDDVEIEVDVGVGDAIEGVVTPGGAGAA